MRKCVYCGRKFSYLVGCPISPLGHSCKFRTKKSYKSFSPGRGDEIMGGTLNYGFRSFSQRLNEGFKLIKMATDGYDD